jgi:hypothetical protein
MRAIVLEEPELEFGAGGKHVDPRFGIRLHGPLDAGTPRAPERIRVGFVGPEPDIAGSRGWLQRAREPIAAKGAKTWRQANLFPEFPGFNQDEAFRSMLVFEERTQRPISAKVIGRLRGLSPSAAVQAAVDAYLEEIEWLAHNERCDVIVCTRPEALDARPTDLEDLDEDEQVADAPPPLLPDFHDQLKAAALQFGQPLQIMRPRTWGDKSKPPPGVTRRAVQDEATRAWNLHTALYYKAGGSPWRLVRSYADTTTCYLGISFYRSADRQNVHTSVAQLFNEKGEGMVVRGGPAAVLKEDRAPHLSEADSHDLVTKALAAYRSEHLTFPARLVVHKSSRFTAEERAGIEGAAEDARVELVELVWVARRHPIRLFRHGERPPLRGTMVGLSRDRLLLYTKGSVSFYGTYPGMYIPTPILLRPVEGTSDPARLAAETLSLTKLNWNQSQLDGHLPITLQASAKVRAILRHLPGEGAGARQYAHYM